MVTCDTGSTWWMRREEPGLYLGLESDGNGGRANIKSSHQVEKEKAWTLFLVHHQFLLLLDYLRKTVTVQICTCIFRNYVPWSSDNAVQYVFN